jgi:hypothetical protein
LFCIYFLAKNSLSSRVNSFFLFFCAIKNNSN